MATKEQMLQEVQDEKDRIKAEKAYNQSLRNTEMDEPVTPKRKMANSEMPNVDQMGNVTGYKKGGMTASSRADGCCVKGKTRGTMITMKGGGYAC
jgi:hypothetical protein